jgi:hypothetical protein
MLDVFTVFMRVGLLALYQCGSGLPEPKTFCCAVSLRDVKSKLYLHGFRESQLYRVRFAPGTEQPFEFSRKTHLHLRSSSTSELTFVNLNGAELGLLHVSNRPQSRFFVLQQHFV